MADERPATRALAPEAGRQRIAGRVIEVCPEPPAVGALGVVWVATVPDSSSILDIRGLVLWPSTAIVVSTGGWTRPGDPAELEPGVRVLASATDEEYWWIPPIYDATRVEILDS